MKISTRGARRIRNGHLWVYRSDVLESQGADPGEIVFVGDEANNFVGQALYSNQSEIALRFLTMRQEAIDREWWRSRLRGCAARRAAIAEETNAYRLVYSEGDLLPSLIVDRYGDVLVMQTLSQGSDRLKATLAELLVEEFQPRAIIERNDARVRQLEGLESKTGLLYESEPAATAAPGLNGPQGSSLVLPSPPETFDLQSAPGATAERDSDTVEINQHGVRFFVTPLSSQKTGAFLDQRENYLAAARIAHGRALDCFTFNGGFALHIAKSCESVLGIDISDEAVAGALRNAKLNQITNVEFRAANVFDELRQMEPAGQTFDTIVLDPPAFTKSRATIKSGARGYKEINLRALKLLTSGGVLVTCTCSYHMHQEMFLELIAAAALDARRRLQIVEVRGQSSDHPVMLGVPETHYLKCVIARVIE